jgi:methionine-rich copper-binding protein CopC
MKFDLRKTALTVTLVFVSTFVASAHAILLKSTPGANEVVAGHNIPVALTFNSKVDQARSTLTLESPDHSTSRLEINVDPSSMSKLVSGVLNLAPGPYKLRWQVLAVDGHITRGEITFQVK